MATMKGEIGSSGRSFSALFQYTLPTDEYFSTLTWPNDIKIYDKMQRSDSQVKAILLLMELPIRSTKWFITPADDSSQAKKNADFIEETLFTGPPVGMQFHWDDFLKNVCSMFAYGHSIFEKVYEVRDGYLKWKKFAIRPQSTIYDFMYDGVGDPASIQQYNVSQNWQIIDIPFDKLLVFSHDMQQGDYRGRSVLRSAYKHWSIKDFLYKITNIGIERNLVGTPTITLPPNYTKDDYELAKNIVKNLRSSEYGGVTLPDGFLLELFEGKRTLMDVMPYIEYQDILISRGILAQFLNLGSKAGGSFALSKDQTDLFLMLLNASCKYICNTINSYAIPQLINYNFNSDLYPKLTFKALGSEKILEAIKLMVDGKIILPDEDLEKYVREMLELPEKSEESYADQMASKALEGQQSLLATKTNSTSGTDGEGNLTNTSQVQNKSLNAQNKEAKITEEEMQTVNEKATGPSATKKVDQTQTKKMSEVTNRVDWKKVDEAFNTLEGTFKTGAKLIIEKQLNDLAKKVKNVSLTEIATVQISFKGQMTNFVKEMYRRAFNEGVVQMQRELNVTNAPKLDESVLSAKASIVANNISERVKTRFLSEYLLQLGIESDIELQSKRAIKAILG